MSVFKKLKGSLQRSQQDIVNGLKTLTSFDVYAKHEQLQHIRAKEINLNIGADLLNSYKESWCLIQSQTKECSLKAEKTASELGPLLSSWNEKSNIVSELEKEIRFIPDTVSSLSRMQSFIGTLRQDFAVVEKSLDILENLCEELDLQKKVMEEQKKLSNYSALKLTQADKVKVDLAKTHAKRMAELETTKQVNLQERAEAFTSAFEEDVNYYKTHGRPDTNPSSKEVSKINSLSEIEIEQDRKALDSFLESNEPDVQEDVEVDEPYFEDDYISDYTIKEDAEFIDDSNMNTPLFEDVYEHNDQDEMLPLSLETEVMEDGKTSDGSLIKATNMDILNISHVKTLSESESEAMSKSDSGAFETDAFSTEESTELTSESVHDNQSKSADENSNDSTMPAVPSPNDNSL